MSLDFTSWKEFCFEDIFDIKKGFYNKRPESYSEGNIPFISASRYNNGVTEYYSLEDIKNSSKTGNDEDNVELSEKIFPANALCVTNNGSVGFAYYQNEEFTCSHDVNPLYLKDRDFNKYTALFIATIIEHDKYRWAYGRKWRPERMKNSLLKLPSTEEGVPDWEYMENYIKSLHHKVITTNNLKNITILDTNNWKNFKFGDLLDEIYKSTAYVEGDMDIVDKLDEYSLPFISRTAENNGCKCYVKNKDLGDIEEGNALTIGDTTATIFYQPDKFITGDHIVICRADWINLYTSLFIKTILDKEKYKYNYGRAFKKDLIKNTIIKLPTNSEGNPDWEYMENYIRNLPLGDRL